MIKYGLDAVTELKFEKIVASMERRNDQWVDIELLFELAEETPAPDDLIDFSGLVICTPEGSIAQMVPLDEDCDCEYQFTAFEKEQITAFILQEQNQLRIRQLPSPI